MRNRRVFLAGALATGVAPAAFAVEPQPAQDARLRTHPSLAAASALFRAGSWRDLGTLVQALPPDSACVLIDDLADHEAVDADISGLADAPMGRTIMGGFAVNWGWRYRGSGFGNTVTNDMGLAFVDRLRLARSHLEGAIAADAHDGVAYNFLIRTLKGASAVSDLQRAWEAFETVERKPVRAYAGMADALAAKWFGSHDLMVGFSRTYQAALEPASRGLMAQTANEILFSIVRSGGPEAAFNFAAQDDVLGEVGAAHQAFVAAAAPADFYQASYAHGHFAYYFAFLGLNDLARPHLLGMGYRLSAPWSNLEQPFDVIERARTAAGITST